MRHLACLAVALLALTSCSTPTDNDRRGPPPLLTELPRALSDGELRIVDGANAFAFDLLRETTKALPADSNLFLSPLSASMALGMALNGASGQTFSDMQKALKLDGMTEAEINEGYQDLIALLGGLDSRTEMLIANSMWSHEGFSISPAFSEAGRTFFDAEIQAIDFGSPEAVETINDWVSGKTKSRIPKLLDGIAREEILFLINAIYFKGKWRHTFDPKDTKEEAFYGADGQSRVARLMWQQETMSYDETDSYQAVDLLYGNGAFAMTVLLPKTNATPAQLLQSLDLATWRALTERFREEEVNLTLPRFRLEYSRRLNGDLEALGMGIAFDDRRADFSRITGTPLTGNLYLTRVDQKTFVEVNEEGTEAAAATAVGVGITSVPQVYEMRVDRPFVFAIRERLSGTVVFLGVMNVVGQ